MKISLPAKKKVEEEHAALPLEEKLTIAEKVTSVKLCKKSITKQQLRTLTSLMGPFFTGFISLQFTLQLFAGGSELVPSQPQDVSLCDRGYSKGKFEVVWCTL